jgi:hypothetical protein
MPQLDLTTLTTQVFWGGLTLFVTYMVLYLFVIPHTMSALRIRDKMVKEMINTKKSDKRTLNTKLQEDLLSIIIELLKFDNQKNKINNLYTNKQDDYTKEFKSFVSKKRLRSIITASKQLNQRFSWVGLFASIISPSDEFILMVCFIVFICIFFFLISSYITNSLDSKLLETKERFLTLVELKKEHNQLRLDTINAIRGLDLDKRKLSMTILSKLNYYTSLSKEAYSLIKLSDIESNLERKLDSRYIAEIQKIMRLVLIPNRFSNIPEPSLFGYNKLPLDNNNTTNALILLELSKLDN